MPAWSPPACSIRCSCRCRHCHNRLRTAPRMPAGQRQTLWIASSPYLSTNWRSRHQIGADGPVVREVSAVEHGRFAGELKVADEQLVDATMTGDLLEPDQWW